MKANNVNNFRKSKHTSVKVNKPFSSFFILLISSQDQMGNSLRHWIYNYIMGWHEWKKFTFFLFGQFHLYKNVNKLSKSKQTMSEISKKKSKQAQSKVNKKRNKLESFRYLIPMWIFFANKQLTSKTKIAYLQELLWYWQILFWKLQKPSWHHSFIKRWFKSNFWFQKYEFDYKILSIVKYDPKNLTWIPPKSWCSTIKSCISSP